MFIPDTNFFHPGFLIKGQKDSRIRIQIKKKLKLTQKNFSKLSEIWSGMFIPDPDPGTGSPDPEPTSDPQHWLYIYRMMRNYGTCRQLLWQASLLSGLFEGCFQDTPPLSQTAAHEVI